MTPMRRHPSPRLPGIAARAREERGIALIIALFATILLTALGVALVLLTTTETKITRNYRDGQQTLYAADAAAEIAVQGLLFEADWNLVLAGTERSGFFDPASVVTLGDGTTLDVESVRAEVQGRTDRQNYWGLNNPRWQWYARGFASNLLVDGGLASDVYVMVLVGDDPAENETVPNRDHDSNGVLTLHVEAFGPGGSRKAIEVTVSRTANAEIERGYIAQRGQEELNQRARKAKVGETEERLTRMGMSLTGDTGLALR